MIGRFYYLIPRFQFNHGLKIPHLEGILGKMENVSQEAKCSFFLSPLRDDVDGDLVYEILNRGASEEELGMIYRDANGCQSSNGKGGSQKVLKLRYIGYTNILQHPSAS
jgi:hypothetical protein